MRLARFFAAGLCPDRFYNLRLAIFAFVVATAPWLGLQSLAAEPKPVSVADLVKYYNANQVKDVKDAKTTVYFQATVNYLGTATRKLGAFEMFELTDGATTCVAGVWTNPAKPGLSENDKWLKKLKGDGKWKIEGIPWGSYEIKTEGSFTPNKARKQPPGKFFLLDLIDLSVVK